MLWPTRPLFESLEILKLKMALCIVSIWIIIGRKLNVASSHSLNVIIAEVRSGWLVNTRDCLFFYSFRATILFLLELNLTEAHRSKQTLNGLVWFVSNDGIVPTLGFCMVNIAKVPNLCFAWRFWG
jgi:hypothetical protein